MPTELEPYTPLSAARVQDIYDELWAMRTRVDALRFEVAGSVDSNRLVGELDAVHSQIGRAITTLGRRIASNIDE